MKELGPVLSGILKNPNIHFSAKEITKKHKNAMAFKSALKNSMTFSELDIQCAFEISGFYEEQNTSLCAAVLALMQSYSSGHLRAGLEMITNEAKRILNSCNIADFDEDAFSSIESLQKNFPQVFGSHADKTFCVAEKGCVYLRKMYNVEKAIISELKRYSETDEQETDQEDIEIAEMIKKAAAENGVEINEEQFQAIVKSLSKSRLLVISGGPGTGKTTGVISILRALYYRAMKRGEPLKSLLCAPTGRAASGLAQSIAAGIKKSPFTEEVDGLIPKTAGTVHSSLGVSSRLLSGFRYNAEKKLPADIIIVDEASMLDAVLVRSIFEAAKNDAKIILVGDKNQLPSVEVGAVFAALSSDESRYVKGSRISLRRNYRTNKGIQNFAEAVNGSDTQKALRLLKESEAGGDIFERSLNFINARASENEDAHMMEMIASGYKLEELKRSALLDSSKEDFDERLNHLFKLLDTFIILIPYKNGPYSVSRVNSYLERKLFNLNKNINGAPLIMTRNNYKEKIYNGDRGVLIKDEHDGMVKAVFKDSAMPGKHKMFENGLLPGLEYSFAITVHKSQGAEFERTAIVMNSVNKRLYSKEMLYTALTRTKSSCVLFSNEENIRHAVLTSTQRLSGIND